MQSYLFWNFLPTFDHVYKEKIEDWKYMMNTKFEAHQINLIP